MDMTAAKRVVQYLHHHPEIGPKYSGNSHTALISYSDADYAGDVATEVALAQHSSRIVIPDPKMCWDHDPSALQKAGIHWDPSKKADDPG